MVSRKLWH